MTLKHAEDFDDVVTETPRSQLKSDDTLPMTHSTGSGSSFGSRSGSPLGSEDVMEQSQHTASGDCKDNDYDAFLREMAGSFEATYDDEEAESEASGSEDGHSGGDNNEESQKDNYDAFLREMAGSFVAASDDDDDDDDEASDDDSDDDKKKEPTGIMQLAPSPQDTKRQNAGLDLEKSVIYGHQSPLWQGSHTVRLANGELKNMDNRLPVPDSYDMVAATAPLEPPSLELPQTFEMQRANLEASIDIQKKQVAALLAVSRKKRGEEALQCHYGRVGMELLTELKSLEQQLAQLSN